MDSKGVVVVLILGFIIILLIFRYCLILPRVWRGEKCDFSGLKKYETGYNIDINVRNFPTFVIFMTCGVGVGLVGTVLDEMGMLPDVLIAPFVVVALCGYLCFPLTIIVNAFNRPKFLVPPPHRDRSGWVVRLWRGDSEGDSQSDNRAETDSSDTDSNSSCDRGDITNGAVQQWFNDYNGRLRRLESQLDRGQAHLVYQDATGGHYAVPDTWWFDIASDLDFGCDSPRTESDLDAIAQTSAFQEHAERVGDFPDVSDTRYRTTPLVVERLNEPEIIQRLRADNRTETD